MKPGIGLLSYSPDAKTAMSDEDTTVVNRVYKKMRGQYEGEDRRSERRQERTDWLKELLPYALGAAVIYAQFQVMAEKIDRLEQGYKAQWSKLSGHLEDHE